MKYLRRLTTSLLYIHNGDKILLASLGCAQEIGQLFPDRSSGTEEMIQTGRKSRLSSPLHISLQITVLQTGSLCSLDIYKPHIGITCILRTICTSQSSAAASMGVLVRQIRSLRRKGSACPCLSLRMKAL